MSKAINKTAILRDLQEKGYTDWYTEWTFRLAGMSYVRKRTAGNTYEQDGAEFIVQVRKALPSDNVSGRTKWMIRLKSTRNVFLEEDTEQETTTSKEQTLEYLKTANTILFDKIKAGRKTKQKLRELANKVATEYLGDEELDRVVTQINISHKELEQIEQSIGKIMIEEFSYSSRGSEDPNPMTVVSSLTSTEKLHDRIIMLSNDGKSFSEIARLLNRREGSASYTPSFIKSVLLKNGEL